MVSRAVLVTLAWLLSLSSFNIPANAQRSAQYSELLNSPSQWHLHTGSISGAVQGPDGSPKAGVHVELQDADTRATVASTSTQPNGTFELYNIPAGRYQVVAWSGGSQASNLVSVYSSQANVTLRFENPSQPSGNNATVSVAAMLVPSKARSFYQKARAACAKGNFDDAQKHLDRAVQAYPHFAEALTLRGLLQLRTNHIDQGRQDFEQAIQYDPNYGPAYVALAAAYNAQARYDDALRTLEREAAIAPTAWQGYLEMAKASIAKGMYDQGLQFAEKAEQLNGNHFAAIHLLKAYAMIPLKFYSRAKEELQAYLQREPTGGNAEQARQMLAQLDAAEMEEPAKTQ
jgi:tetratricopeptide (TPR) repeat protein